jgi:polar amino acid transport system permease protein
VKELTAPPENSATVVSARPPDPWVARLSRFPWWVLGLVIIALWTFYIVTAQDSYREAFVFIWEGIGVTITISLAAYAIALVLGLIAGLGRISHSTVIKNLFTLYVELIRGIPMLVVIFYIALVGVPAAVGVMKSLGEWLASIGLTSIGGTMASIDNQGVPMTLRAIIALSITYGAFQAEIFRAGIQSIGRGQMEAARSLGMSYWQAMRYIILPQAVRNVLPALGNDFIAMVKDSSLVSVLAVRDITQVARLYAGRSFRFPEAYTVLAVLYLTMTLILSLFVKLLERRLFKNERQS